MRRYPTMGEALAARDGLIDAFGGAHGVRDLGALDSAILRPQIDYYDGIVEEAAAMMESLAINHPFMDGNKRVAFFLSDSFLRTNGYPIACGDREAYAFFWQLFESNAFRYAHPLSWLEEHVKPLPSNGSRSPQE